MLRKLFAFDFHGVLSRNNELAVMFYINWALEQFGVNSRINLETIVLQYGISFQKYFEMVYPEGDMATYDKMATFINQQQQRSFMPVQERIKPQVNAEYVLKQLKLAGHDLIVVSNTPQNMIVNFTDAVGLTNKFDHVIGVGEVGGISCPMALSDHKANVLKKFAASGFYDQIIMVGDAASDILAGKAAEATTYLFASPLYSRICNMDSKWERIKNETKPDYFITDLKSLLHQK